MVRHNAQVINFPVLLESRMETVAFVHHIQRQQVADLRDRQKRRRFKRMLRNPARATLWKNCHRVECHFDIYSPQSATLMICNSSDGHFAAPL